MVCVKFSISLSPDVAAALDQAVKTQAIDRSRLIERAIIAHLNSTTPNGPPIIRPERLAKLLDIGALAKARVDELTRTGAVQFG